MALLRPLLLDNVPSIQQSAALALGRLANYSDELAEAVVSNEILPQLVYSLAEQNVSTYNKWKSHQDMLCGVVLFLNMTVISSKPCISNLNIQIKFKGPMKIRSVKLNSNLYRDSTRKPLLMCFVQSPSTLLT